MLLLGLLSFAVLALSAGVGIGFGLIQRQIDRQEKLIDILINNLNAKSYIAVKREVDKLD